MLSTVVRDLLLLAVMSPAATERSTTMASKNTSVINKQMANLKDLIKEHAT
jgi:hypothetical protein